MSVMVRFFRSVESGPEVGDKETSVKTTIREGVFETNSSSVHAIVINKRNMPVPENRKSITQVRAGDYGWEYREYRTSAEKLNYLWTAIVDNRENTEEWKEYICDTIGIPESTNFITDVDEDDPYVAEKIDHARELKPFLEDIHRDSELLKRFIRGDAYVVIYDGNDEYMQVQPELR